MLQFKLFAGVAILYMIMSLKHRKINAILRRNLNYNINQTVLLYSGGLSIHLKINRVLSGLLLMVFYSTLSLGLKFCSL